MRQHDLAGAEVDLCAQPLVAPPNGYRIHCFRRAKGFDNLSIGSRHALCARGAPVAVLFVQPIDEHLALGFALGTCLDVSAASVGSGVIFGARERARKRESFAVAGLCVVAHFLSFRRGLKAAADKRHPVPDFEIVQAISNTIVQLRDFAGASGAIRRRAPLGTASMQLLGGIPGRARGGQQQLDRLAV